MLSSGECGVPYDLEVSAPNGASREGRCVPDDPCFGHELGG